ncbi:MFS transporter [Rhodophyticola porphyridii]|uniref:MFS transporter n=1 Tax=Rhodophyticola porphyridii TaxID=1852017 RepID=UPI0035CF7BB4
MTLIDRRTAMLIAICIASFLEPLATTVVVVALPAIQQATDATFADLQWIVNAYVLTFAALVLTGGALADRFGRKLIFQTGLLAFLAGSIMCGIANIPITLSIGRGIAGLGSAFMLSAGLALIVQDFHGRERVRAFAIWGVIVCAGAVFGPLIGGLITDGFGWRWIFLSMVPVCLPLLLLTHWSTSESRDPLSHELDWLGLTSFTAMFFVLMYVLIEGNALGWTSPIVLALLAATVILTAIFIAGQLRQSRPMFDLSLFADRTFTGASVVAVVIAAAFFTLIVYLPLYFQGVVNYGPTEAGLALLPLGIPLLLMGPISGRLAAIMSPKLFLPLGLLIIAGGAACIALMPQLGVMAVYAGMFIAGIGAGLINGELSNVAISVVEPERSGMASGINNTMRQFGYGIGIAGLGALFGGMVVSALADRGRDFAERVASGDIEAAITGLPDVDAARIAADTAFIHAFSTICFVAASIAAIGAVLAFVLIRRERPAETPPSVALADESV